MGARRAPAWRSAAVGVTVVALLGTSLAALSSGATSAPDPMQPVAAVTPAEDGFDTAMRGLQSYVVGRLGVSTDRLSTSAWPIQTSGTRWTTTGPRSWTSGFFPGTLWLAYQGTRRGTFRTEAQSWQAGLAGQASNTTTHDLGFMVFDSFGNGYRLTGIDAYRQIALKAAAALSTRYSPRVGALRSWNSGPSEFRVVVDTMMNLELLFWASRHGAGHSVYDMAVSHALTTARTHVRPDGSTFHLVVFDPVTGGVRGRTTVQGASSSSTWARGQAWAIHGFTTTFRETKDPRFLDTARRTADWYLDHLPSDHIPYWDFSAPGIPDAVRDTSAAAVAASGLLGLARLDPDPARCTRYLTAARATLLALASSPWLSLGTGSEAVLLHGTYSAPAGNVDTGLVWGDYFLQEALTRLRRIPPTRGALPVSRVSASSDDGHVPRNAVDGLLTTRWSAHGDGQWLQLDLGSPQVVTKVTVAVYQGATRASRFDIQTSVDGRSWTTRTSAVTCGTTAAAETYDMPDTVARYIRYLGHGASGTWWNSVTELRAIG